MPLEERRLRMVARSEETPSGVQGTMLVSPEFRKAGIRRGGFLPSLLMPWFCKTYYNLS